MKTAIENVTEQNKLMIHSNYLWYLTLTYSMVIVLSNWFDPRLIKMGVMVTDAGTLIFPFSFLLSNLITEIYGYKYARRTIWCGFLFNLIFIIYGQLIVHMPNPDFLNNNALFDALLTINSRIIFASFISYFVSECFNSYIISIIKIKTKGRHMGLRFFLSTFIASGLDSIIFMTIGFYKTIPDSFFLSMMLTMWFIKVFIELCGLPFSLKLVNRIKKIEKLDIYDNQTNFNLFCFDLNYTQQENKYLEKN